jgi:hypothetical protein
MKNKKIFPKNTRECDRTDCFKKCGYMKTDSRGGKCISPDFDKQENKQEGKNWKNNRIQFPRLIAELEACGAFNDNVMSDLSASMCLDYARIRELIDRAQVEYDNIIMTKYC